MVFLGRVPDFSLDWFTVGYVSPLFVSGVLFLFFAPGFLHLVSSSLGRGKGLPVVVSHSFVVLLPTGGGLSARGVAASTTTTTQPLVEQLGEEQRKSRHTPLSKSCQPDQAALRLATRMDWTCEG